MSSIGDERRYSGYCEFYDSYRRICELANRYPSENEISSYCNNQTNSNACWDCYYYCRYPHPEEESETKSQKSVRPDPIPSHSEIPIFFDDDDVVGDGEHYRQNPSGRGLFSGLLSLASILIGIIICVLLVKSFGPLLIHPKLTCTFNPTDPCHIPVEQVELCLVSQKTGKEEYRVQFDQSGTCKLQVKPGTYDLYCAYNGNQFHYFTRELSLFYNYEQPLPISDEFFFRGILFRLWNDTEQIILPEISVADENDTYLLNVLPDGSYCLNKQYVVSDYACTVSAEGYQPIQVSLDLSSSILSILDLNMARGQ